MGDRVSIRFVNGADNSVALFSHWGGMDFKKKADSYARALKKWAKSSGSEFDPLHRLEPATVMVDFIRHITKGMERVESDLYLGVDHGDGDNSDQGGFDIDLLDKDEVIKEFEGTKEQAELRALSTASLERELTDKEFARMKVLSKKIYGIGGK